MTIPELEQHLSEAEKEIRQAVEPIIARLRLPRAVELYSIQIPILDVTNLGDTNRKLLLGQIEMETRLTIDTTIHSEQRLANK